MLRSEQEKANICARAIKIRHVARSLQFAVKTELLGNVGEYLSMLQTEIHAITEELDVFAKTVSTRSVKKSS